MLGSARRTSRAVNNKTEEKKKQDCWTSGGMLFLPERSLHDRNVFNKNKNSKIPFFFLVYFRTYIIAESALRVLCIFLVVGTTGRQ